MGGAAAGRGCRDSTRWSPRLLSRLGVRRRAVTLREQGAQLAMNLIELALGLSDLLDLLRREHVANRDRVVQLLLRHLILNLVDLLDRRRKVGRAHCTCRGVLRRDLLAGGL